MSVINKMLQDLDKRQQGHSLTNITPHQVQYLGRTGSSYKWLFVSLASVLIGGLAVYAFQFSNGAKEMTGTVTAKAVEEQAVTQNTQPPESNDNKLGAQVEVKSDGSQGIDKSALANVSQPQPIVNQSHGDIKPRGDGQTTTAIQTNTTAERPVEQIQTAQVEPATPLGQNIETAKLNNVGNMEPIDPNQTAQAEPSAIPSAQNIEMAKANNIETFDHIEPNLVAQEPIEVAAPQSNASGRMAVTEVKLSPSQLAQKQMSLAVDAEKEGQLLKAMGYYGEALKLDPSLHEARKQLAALHYGQGELKKAENILAQGRLLYPQEFEFTLLLARVQHAMGNTDLALASLGQIPDSHILARQKWLAQSDLAQKNGQFALAEQAYRQLLQQEPQQGKWWMGLAYVLDSQKKFGQASQAYRTALTYPGLSAQATAFIEQRLHQLGDSQ